MKSIDETINTVKQRLYSELNHSYLTNQLDNPFIDDQKLYLLLHMLEDQRLPDNLIEDYALTVVLIQLALDTHDLIENELEFIDKRTQLTVLAGDFYSGLYYQILANIEDIQFIRVLAHGVKKVNENKMLICNNEIHSFEDFMNSMNIIESMICQQVAVFFDNKKWIEITANWLHLYHLLIHKDWYINYSVKYQLRPLNGLKGELSERAAESYVQDYITKLEESIKQATSKTEFSHLLNQLPGSSNKRSLV